MEFSKSLKMDMGQELSLPIQYAYITITKRTILQNNLYLKKKEKSFYHQMHHSLEHCHMDKQRNKHKGNGKMTSKRSYTSG